jgi:hypothetical protein
VGGSLALGPKALYAPEPAAGASFGASVAARGERVLVGAPGRDGAAYLFEVPPGEQPPPGVAWGYDRYQARLTFTNPTPAASDFFGFSVALVGDYVAVGAPFDDMAAENAGAVYLFHAFSGQLLETLFSPEPQAGGRFGFSLAAMDDDRLIVGAPNDGLSQTGAAYLFDVRQPDSDGDGAIDAVEAGAPNGGDANADGTPDRDQAHVASFFDHFREEVGSSDGYATLVAPAGTRLTGVRMTPIPPSSVRPLGGAGGYLNYVVEDVSAPGAVQLQLTFHDRGAIQVVPVAYMQHGPELDRPATAADESLPHWFDFAFDGQTGMSLASGQLDVADGQMGDADLLANGRIVGVGAFASILDTDHDGAPDALEDLAPNGGNGNPYDGLFGDFQPDRFQPSVASLPAIDRSMVTLESRFDQPLSRVRLRPSSVFALPPGASFPVGFLDFSAPANDDGALLARLILHGNPPVDSYYRYGPAESPQWYDLAFVGEAAFPENGIGAGLDDNVITLSLRDGERGDQDGVNGQINFGIGGPVRLPDADGDGAPDLLEAGAPHGGDGNADGIPDGIQNSVASLRGADGTYVTLLAPAGASLSEAAVVAFAPYVPGEEPYSTLPDDLNFWFGMLDFTLEGLAAGQAATADLLVHAPHNLTNDYRYFDTYFNFTPTAGAPAEHYYEFAFDAAAGVGARITGDRISLDLVDGGLGDADLAADGRVVTSGGWGWHRRDGDGDHTDDAIEDHAPGGDGNGDGIPDRDQAHVTSLVAADGQFVTVVFPENSTPRFIQFRSAESLNPPPPAGVSFPLGLLEFILDGVAPGGLATIELIVPSGSLPTSYYKIGPRPDNPAIEWYDFAFDAATGTGAQFLSDRVVLQFVDNQRGDDNLTRDGWISDPGGPAIVVPQVPTVLRVEINDGSMQRSMVNSLTVAFNGLVTIGKNAFELRKIGSNRAVELKVVTSTEEGHTVARLTFRGGRDTIGGSLRDGTYQLTIRADKIKDAHGNLLDGDGDGDAGGNYVDEFFRRFGDTDGDGDVDLLDAEVFASTFGKRQRDAGYLWYLDFNANGRVWKEDLALFLLGYCRSNKRN